ncbi:putative MATE efflux family protein subfamily [Aspergillus bombycis]|uniref:Putative MATE efflux family protein subfamily n=1 Tax=Aspergillus bombycis TaxID=109264 RepID=A0A1F8ACU0_9EURO|nr:putative MATE efflux family protein subfamily [Aspergillus bombycis]OGM49219.1 putative MATE efflux family protein subfamily [Aspergillus bombycis]
MGRGNTPRSAEDQALHGRFLSSSPLAEAAIARDLENYADDEGSMITTDDEASETSTIRAINSQPGTNPHSLAGSYRRPSFFTTVSHATVVPYTGERERLTRRERERAIEDERDLLSDNNVMEARAKRRVTPTSAPSGETTALLGSRVGGREYNATDDEEVDRKWEEAVAAGLIHTTWRREARVIGKNAAPLMVTFLLQYSLTVASIFTLGHLGKKELGAVSLASMSANITGYAVYQGLATSLDTLCSQAYGSGRKKLVGLQMQKMVFFLCTITVPIAVLWFFADRILMKIVPEKDVAALAGLYLKVVILGAPGYACFESGKRYVQAQGLFSASLYVLLICAPLNAFMNWLFVWKFQWGFVGAPIAVAITDNLMPLFLFLYVYFIDGAESSSYLGTTPLAAQSVLSTIASITFQIPFPLSISGSTRVANLIGATLVGPAKISAKVTMGYAVIVGMLNMLLLSSLRSYIPRLFTPEEEVIELVAQVLPLCAAFQLFDALAANCNGILRGIGRQEIGGYVQLFCYYAVAMPISFGTTFGMGWGLLGLWSGVALALLLVSVIEVIFLIQTDWNRSVQDAIQRNAMA